MVIYLIKIKKILIIIGLLSILTTISFAEMFTSLSYGRSLDDIIVIDDKGNDILFNKIEHLDIKIGTQHFPIEESGSIFGFYIGYADSGSSDTIMHIHNNKKEEFKYSLKLYNVGVTFPINNNFVLLGGIGLEKSEVIINEKDGYFKDNKFNVNGGITMYLLETKFGVIMEYNSAPNSINIGLAYRYRLGQ